MTPPEANTAAFETHPVKKHPVLIIPEVPDKADRETLLARIIEFETSKAGPLNLTPLAILIKDDEGTTIGGLWGTTVFRWLVVETLIVPDRFRGTGLGSDIMAEAERIALERGCIGIWLDTYSFQARGFYEKIGFSVFGQVDDHPPGEQRFFMKKSIVA